MWTFDGTSNAAVLARKLDSGVARLAQGTGESDKQKTERTSRSVILEMLSVRLPLRRFCAGKTR
jgi:hypothetical protein